MIALAVCASAASTRAQPVQTSSTSLPVAKAFSLTGSISVDGKLDEAAWASATPITDFRQQQPREGAPASQRTEVRVLYDERAIYIGARMYDSLGGRGIHAPVSRRDQLLDSNGNNGSFNSLTTDKLIVILDPYHNKIDQVLFEVNPAGVRGDQFNGDASWDPIWEAATRVDSLGWTAEMRIPYSQLRFSRDSLQTWGLQIWRYTDRLHEQDMWSFRRMSEAGGPAYYGSLTGLTIGAQPRQLELLPYVESREQYKYATPGDPYHSNSYGRVSAGADIKYLLTPSLALDATII
ncbi:MAG TPA: carbohydrate binding family 9 domain-containing protein, partial [Gemmatimonadaceae bacterium]|nr:carbohydrate binding family 9 domain-containing protein [Gemmatimonadaceae bacterium]